MKRAEKITLGEVRSGNIRGLLVYCSDDKCGHRVRISGEHWPDTIRLSDLEDGFFCVACGQRGADIRPDLDWDKRAAN
jgi:hypothetical protein